MLFLKENTGKYIDGICMCIQSIYDKSKKKEKKTRRC